MTSGTRNLVEEDDVDPSNTQSLQEPRTEEGGQMAELVELKAKSLELKKIELII